MKLTHRQLEMFQSLMQTLSITETAIQLNSSQPTISRELKTLEARLGFPLFSRENRRLEVTLQAAAFNVIVQRSFVSLGEISRAARAISDDRLQRVSIACLPAVAHALLPGAIKQFRKVFPDASIKIHSLEEMVLTRDMLSKLFDLGIVEGNLGGTTNALTKLYAGDMVCVLPMDHPLTERDCIAMADFEGHDFIYYSEEDSYRRQIDAQFAEAGVIPNLMIETTTAASIGAMVAAGQGVSIINPLSALAFEGKDLAIRPIDRAIPYNLNLWRPASGQQSQLASHFVEVITERLREIVETLVARGLCQGNA